MATQAFPYLAISDGTTTVTIMDGSGGTTNYPLIRDAWTPAAPHYRNNRLGGHGSYDDVVEQMTINVRGATAAAAMANLGTLAQLLDQAERWWNGEDVAVVLIKYAPQGSTIASTASPYQAVILGRAIGDETTMNLSDRFGSVGMLFEIMDVQVKFLRRGQWIGPTDSGSSAAVNPAAISNANYGGSPWLTSSPTKLALAITGVNPNTVQTISEAVLLMAHSSAGIDIFDMESLTIAKYTSVADAANKARGGSVLRYTPTDSAFWPTNSTSAGVGTATTRIGVWMAVRSNILNVTWTIRVVGQYSATLDTVRTPEYTFVPNDTNPTIIFLGYLASDFGFSALSYEAKASTTVGGPTLDMDYRVLLIGSSEHVRAIAFDPIPASGTVTPTLTVDPAPLTRQRAIVSYAPSATPGPVTYRGDAFTTIASPSAAVGAGTYFTLLATYNNNWRLVDTAGNLVTVSLSGTRYTAYLTPQ